MKKLMAIASVAILSGIAFAAPLAADEAKPDAETPMQMQTLIIHNSKRI